MACQIYLIAHNLRSAHNVGSLFRTADGLGVEKIYLTGYTPYPEIAKDTRLPHVRRRATNQIAKTALGAEKVVPFEHGQSLEALCQRLKRNAFSVIALEQTKDAQDVRTFKAPQKTVLLVGNEVDGLDQNALSLVDQTIHIPMLGQKESFNVTIAAAIALYSLRG